MRLGLLCLLFFLCNCLNPSIHYPSIPPQTTLGEVTAELIDDYVQHASCSEAKQTAWYLERDQFILTFDFIFTPETLHNSVPNIVSIVQQHAQQRTLQPLLKWFSQTLGALGDTAPSNQETLIRFLRLLQTPSTFNPYVVGTFLEPIITESATRNDIEKWIAFTQASPSFFEDVFDVARVGTEELKKIQACFPGFSLQAFTEPTYTNDTESVTYAPISNEQGQAKTTRALSLEEHRPYLAHSRYHDAYGRALDDEPEHFLYDYAYLEETPLSSLQKLLGYLQEEHFLSDIVTMLHAFQTEQEQQHLHDFLQTSVRLLEPESVHQAIATITHFLTTSPEQANVFMHDVGSLMQSFTHAHLSFLSQDAIVLLQNVEPLLQPIFTNSNNHMPQALSDVVDTLYLHEQTFLRKLDYTLRYTHLQKNAECADEKPDLNASTEVDLSKPRYFIQNNTWVDNRTTLEQSIELLSDLDCGSIPFTHQTVGSLVLDIFAKQNPQNVCSLVNTSLSVMNFIPTLSSFFIEHGLNLIGCDGERIYQELQALDGLAKSGALDILLPVAQVFVERNQTQDLMQLLNYFAQDLKQDEDLSQETYSKFRRLLPWITTAMRTGVLQSAIDIHHTMKHIASTQQGTLVDDMIQVIQTMLEPNNHSRLKTLLQQSMHVATILEQHQEQDTFFHMQSTLATLLDDEHVPAYHLTSNLTLLLQAFNNMQQEYDSLHCLTEQLHQSIDLFNLEEHRKPLMRVIEHLANTSNTSFDTFTYMFHAQEPNEHNNTLFGSSTRLAFLMMQSPLSMQDILQIASWFSHLENNATMSQTAMNMIQTLVEQPSTTSIQPLLERALSPYLRTDGSLPIVYLLDTLLPLARIDENRACIQNQTLQLTQAQTMLKNVSAFLDPDTGSMSQLLSFLTSEQP